MTESSIAMSIHGEGNPLVLFHGWGFDRHVWEPLISALTPHYQLYLVDLPGFGLTPSMTWDCFKTHLLMQLPTPFAVAGWSMGGLFATRLALDAPHRVSHLINIASSPCFIQKKPHWPGVDEQVFQTFYDDVIVHPEETTQAFIALQLQGQTLAGTVGHFATVDGLLAGLDVLLTWDLREALLQLTLPVCYVFGGRDRIISRKTSVVMQHRYPAFHYTLIENAGHALFLSHTAVFTTALHEFLQ